MTTSDDEHVPAPSDSGPEPQRAEQLAPYDDFYRRVSAACRDAGTQQALRRGLGKPVDELPARTHAALLRKGLLPYDLPEARKRAYYAVAALIAARPRGERESERKSSEALEAARGGEESPEGTAPTDTGEEPRSAPNTADPTSDAPASSAPAESSRAPRPSWGRSLGACLALADDRSDPESDKIRGMEARLHLLVRQDTDGLHRMLPALLRQMGSAGVPADYGRLLDDLIKWPTRRGEIATRWLEDYYRTLRHARAAEPETPSA